MAMAMSSLLNGKDSRWLQLEVCREFQRNKCTRPDTECKFAHPPANVEVQNGRVTACYDSIKVTNRCIIEFSYSRVTSAFARDRIAGPPRAQPINFFTYLTPSENRRKLSLVFRSSVKLQRYLCKNYGIYFFSIDLKSVE